MIDRRTEEKMIMADQSGERPKRPTPWDRQREQDRIRALAIERAAALVAAGQPTAWSPKRKR